MTRVVAGRWAVLAAAGLVLFSGLLVTSWQIGAYLARRRALTSAGFSDELPRPGAGDSILVVAPHPDDEVLGCGGLIDQAIRAGAQVHVAIMTNGDASELALIFGEKDLPLGPKAFVTLGRRRQLESLRALRLLGVADDHVYFLSYPNNGLLALWKADHWLHSMPYRSPYTRTEHSPYERSFTPGAAYCGAQVTADLLRLLKQVKPTAIYVTHPQDIHPDHWATCAFVRFALAAAQQFGEQGAQQAKVYGYLVHWPGWPLPRAWAPKLALAPPADLLKVAPELWFELPLDTGAERQKTRALRCYRSQEPSSDRLLLAFLRTNEAFALLQPVAYRTGKQIFWRDETSNHRKLGGADVQALYMEIRPGGQLTANFVCAPHPLPKKGYLALDLRTWDADGRAVVATIYITGPGQGHVRMLTGGSLTTLALPVSQSGPGLWTAGPVKLPAALAQPGRILLLGWGSVRERRTDPAPWPGQ